MTLNPCPDCNSSEFVKSYEQANSRYACMFWNVACSNPECQKRFWPDNKMPRCTVGNYDTKEEAETAWNAGQHTNHSFSVGGCWTGD